MGSLKSSLPRHARKIFILDRNTGRCTHFNTKDARELVLKFFGDRFVEQLKTRGTWTWVILERVPGYFKGGIKNERLQRDFDAGKIY